MQNASPSVRFPNTCPHNKRSFTYIRLLTAVSPNASNGVAFEGRLFPVGARIAAEELGKNPVLLEHAGPQGNWKRGKHREHLWILWRFDWAEYDWREIARASALDWSWAPVLREAAIRALYPESRGQVDTAKRGREITEGLLHQIDTALFREMAAVRTSVLASLYDQIAGRIVV